MVPEQKGRAILDTDPMTKPTTANAPTALVGLLGDPVHHSLSPVMHNAALEAMGRLLAGFSVLLAVGLAVGGG